MAPPPPPQQRRQQQQHEAPLPPSLVCCDPAVAVFVARHSAAAARLAAALDASSSSASDDDEGAQQQLRLLLELCGECRAAVTELWRAREAALDAGRVAEVASGAFVHSGQRLLAWMGGARPSDYLACARATFGVWGEELTAGAAAGLSQLQAAVAEQQSMTAAFTELSERLARTAAVARYVRASCAARGDEKEEEESEGERKRVRARTWGAAPPPPLCRRAPRTALCLAPLPRTTTAPAPIAAASAAAAPPRPLEQQTASSRPPPQQPAASSTTCEPY